MSETNDAQPQYSAEYLTKTLKSKLEAAHVEIQDLSGGCGSAFDAVIVSQQFEGKRSTLQRHRLVNAALKDELRVIHAWSMKCYTFAEWDKLRQEGTGASSSGGAVPGVPGTAIGTA